MSIIFNIKQGGLGRRLPGRDYVSGFVFAFTNANLPAGFGVNDRIKKVESLDEAIALGITEDAANDEIKALYYHVSEFFLMYEQKTDSIGELWINLYDNLAGFAEADVTDLQTAAAGEIRQFYVWTNVVYAASLLTTAGTAAATMLGDKLPAVIVVGADHDGVLTADLPDARTVAQQFVSVDIAQDVTPGGYAATLYASLGASVGSGGTMLGIMAAAPVSTNIGYGAAFNIADAVRWQVPGLVNGDSYDDLTAANLASFVTKGLIFVEYRRGVNGAWYADSFQAVAADNDFAYIENSRTIQKAIREIHKKLIPFQNAPIQVNATDGTIAETTIFELESAVFGALNQMGADFEISVDPTTGRLPLNAVFIDPDQNVLATSTVKIIVRIVPIGVQRETIINIGFTPKLNAAA